MDVFLCFSFHSPCFPCTRYVSCVVCSSHKTVLFLQVGTLAGRGGSLSPWEGLSSRGGCGGRDARADEIEAVHLHPVWGFSCDMLAL